MGRNQKNLKVLVSGCGFLSNAWLEFSELPGSVNFCLSQILGQFLRLFINGGSPILSLSCHSLITVTHILDLFIGWISTDPPSTEVSAGLNSFF